jgi:CRP-like cAMP-binding protein
MQDLAAKTILFHQKIEIISKRSTRDKLMTYLMLQAKKAGSNRFSIPFDRQELADYLEVDRSGLSAEIGKLRREGVLDSHKQHFELLRLYLFLSLSTNPRCFLSPRFLTR